jgi:hypothetical protein
MSRRCGQREGRCCKAVEEVDWDAFKGPLMLESEVHCHSLFPLLMMCSTPCLTGHLVSNVDQQRIVGVVCVPGPGNPM